MSAYRAEPDDVEVGSPGRLPGVAGLDVDRHRLCPRCGEPNPKAADRVRCIRCTALLEPPPPPLVVPPPAAWWHQSVRRPHDEDVAVPSWWERWWPALAAVALVLAVLVVALIAIG